MTVIDRSALVGHTAREMYSLVADVESYPQFLPWCERVAVSVNEPERTVAALYINFRGLKQQFTTENINQPGARIDIKLVSGPFRTLEGSWLFTRLSEKGCKVELSLRYEFANTLIEKAVGPVFHHIADSFVDAFERRANDRFGNT
ncbi:MAG TPA: type II toxin-antitoxin system RatA family toxin [Burkholderiales bacterium]|jgi:ribosome-associated toxin RatA of RatAB toxin-antitoxin module|nr:type II toxin-antitoxin system RatA family toxin [Burkholderiales bacterium]